MRSLRLSRDSYIVLEESMTRRLFGVYDPKIPRSLWLRPQTPRSLRFQTPDSSGSKTLLSLTLPGLRYYLRIDLIHWFLIETNCISNARTTGEWMNGWMKFWCFNASAVYFQNFWCFVWKCAGIRKYHVGIVVDCQVSQARNFVPPSADGTPYPGPIMPRLVVWRAIFRFLHFFNDHVAETRFVASTS